ncbi:hypothetical protein OIU79_026496 [Salix purpurea]|uniref:Uncharacterized protein n=1 Tax=Salix purpurea TaxID=77065 RepID=A0A9Q0VUE0_SALPP|nr:hypothetical protein OIU79_026496 [Salix purpurea]
MYSSKYIIRHNGSTVDIRTRNYFYILFVVTTSHLQFF